MRKFDLSLRSSRSSYFATFRQDRKSGSAGMPRPTSYAVFCLKKKTLREDASHTTIVSGTSLCLGFLLYFMFLQQASSTLFPYTTLFRSDKAGITTACLRIKSKWTAGGK